MTKQRWWTLVATSAVAVLGVATGQLHFKTYPRTVARIDGVQPAPDLIHEPALEYVASRPDYAFAYGVEDPFSGSAQSHQEEREGDVVRGEYKVREPDGTHRTVTYTVDPKRGFQANVEHEDDFDVPFESFSTREQMQSRAQAAQAAHQQLHHPHMAPHPNDPPLSHPHAHPDLEPQKKKPDFFSDDDFSYDDD